MLKPITNWRRLCRVLRALSAKIFECVDCGHVWISFAPGTPARCPNPECRALATSTRRERVGRPRA